ncbi:cytochrome P450 [Suillus occidentalis]|nr:cytochrome P450 [Suillus occidentalis]
MLDDGPVFYLAISALAIFTVLGCCQKYRLSHSQPQLALPGPKPLPVFGNMLSLDAARPWLTFSDWRSTYGNMIYARLLNKPILVINSEEIAKDLFERRSNIYSDRTQSFVYEAFASDFNLAFMQYGDRWRLHQRLLHQSFNQAEIPTYHAAQLRSAHRMLFGLLQDPGNCASHFRTYTVTFVLSLIYDCGEKVKDDHIVHAVTSYAALIEDGLAPTAMMLMETFPFLLQLPSWFPGATFKRASIKCIQAGQHVKEILFQHVKEKMTVSTLLVFLLAMILNPEVQAKAHEEIDRVVGKDRLPDFTDRPALPYVEAILRETFRWHPVTPFGVPHATTTSDVYNGYFIPKGLYRPDSMTAADGAMTHDPKKYPNPDEFKPERFLHEDGSLTSDTMSIVFGWGRRICPGRHVADASVWIAIVNFLAFFSAHKARDERGVDIPIVPKFSTGFTIHPEIFPCRVVPRFPDASEKTLMHLTGLGPSVYITPKF